MKKRDKTIDHLRGFAMLWVIVVHVLYWGDFFDNVYINLLKSFCLFEMPLFFFVTGASNSFSKVEGYFNFVFKRYKRILIPYWVFAFICAGFSGAYLGMFGGISITTAVKIMLSWLVPIDRQITSIPYLTWALWFVPVYLCVILIIPLLKRMKQSKNSIVFLGAQIILFMITCFCNMGWIQHVVFYSLWTYVGLFYSDIIVQLENHNFRKQISLVALMGMVTMLVLYAMGESVDMQYNKFPPNIMFGAFSIVMMSVILLMVPNINKLYDCIERCKLVNRALELFSTRSMTIFLYQVFVFNLTIKLSNVLIPGSSGVVSAIRSILCLIITVPLCAVLALVFGGVEKIGTECCNRNMKNTNQTITRINEVNKQLVLYLFFGVCTTVVNIVCYWLLYETFMLNNIVSTLMAWLFAVVFAFFTNKVYVFESKRTTMSERVSEVAFFLGCRILTGVLDVLIMTIAVDMLKGNGLMWKCISNIIVTAINYIASKYLIFRKNVK